MPGETHHVSALAALIEDVMRRESADGHELNYSDIARRGTDVSRGNVRSYATKKLDRVIEIEKRHGLALGLRVHPVLVDRAIAEDVGLLMEPPIDDWRTDPDLTWADRREIEAYIVGIKSRQGRKHG